MPGPIFYSLFPPVGNFRFINWESREVVFTNFGNSETIFEFPQFPGPIPNQGNSNKKCGKSRIYTEIISGQRKIKIPMSPFSQHSIFPAWVISAFRFQRLRINKKIHITDYKSKIIDLIYGDIARFIEFIVILFAFHPRRPILVTEQVA